MTSLSQENSQEKPVLLIKAENAGYPKKPLNADSWPMYFFDTGAKPDMLLGYWDSTNHTIESLRQILKSATDFAQLKKELLTFVIDRRQFSKSLRDAWDDEDGGFKGIDPNSVPMINI